MAEPDVMGLKPLGYIYFLVVVGIPAVLIWAVLKIIEKIRNKTKLGESKGKEVAILIVVIIIVSYVFMKAYSPSFLSGLDPFILKMLGS